jgi:thiosulfate/3-mercaptopyruvate sulfurtransferase
VVDAAAAVFGRLGIDASKQVVAYDQGEGVYASRMWWMLRWLGHDTVAVLDGGFKKWTAEGRPTKSGVESRAPREFVASVRTDMAVDVKTVAAANDLRLVDARAPERYRGEVEPIDKKPGHIPGAANHFFGSNLEGGTFRTPEDLRARFKDALGNTPHDHIVCYCGSGVTACHNLLALEHAGIHGARLYAGSWSEWSSDPNRGVETGGRSESAHE